MQRDQSVQFCGTVGKFQHQVGAFHSYFLVVGQWSLAHVVIHLG